MNDRMMRTSNKSERTRIGTGTWLELKYEDVKRAIEGGNNSATTKLAWLKLSGLGGADVDEDGAVAMLEKRVRDRDTDAMWILGACYEYGMGIEQDIKRAEALYKQSSEKGNEIGLFFEYRGWNIRGSGKMIMQSL